MLHCMYILHFLHPSSIKGHLGCFHLLDLWIMLLRIGTYKCLFKILLSIALFSLVTFLQIGRLIHQRRRWHPSPVLLPGKSHGRRRLVGYSPWGCEESDTTERLPFFFFFNPHVELLGLSGSYTLMFFRARFEMLSSLCVFPLHYLTDLHEI